MPYQINGPALFEVQIVGLLHAQTTRNVFHYAKTDEVGIADGQTAVSQLVGWFVANVFAPYKAAASNEWSLIHVSGQTIKPLRYRMFTLMQVPPTGGLQENALPSGCSAVISTSSDYAGRKYQGRKYVAGLPISADANSKLDPVHRARIQEIADAMLSPISVGPTSVVPWVGSQTPTLDPVYNSQYRITEVLVRDTIRYQRRREVGKGE